MEVNTQYFGKDQIKDGTMQKLLDYLLAEAYSGSLYYNDIHINPVDCGAFVIEWVQVPWDHSFGGNFKYVDEDSEVMLVKELPDKTCGYFHDEEEYNEALDNWSCSESVDCEV